jgi:hypothetical protein
MTHAGDRSHHVFDIRQGVVCGKLRVTVEVPYFWSSLNFYIHVPAPGLNGLATYGGRALFIFYLVVEASGITLLLQH